MGEKWFKKLDPTVKNSQFSQCWDENKIKMKCKWEVSEPKAKFQNVKLFEELLRWVGESFRIIENYWDESEKVDKIELLQKVTETR